MQLVFKVRRLKQHCEIFSLKHVQKSVRLHHTYPKSYIKFILIDLPIKNFVRFSKIMYRFELESINHFKAIFVSCNFEFFFSSSRTQTLENRVAGIFLCLIAFKILENFQNFCKILRSDCTKMGIIF